MDLCFHLANVLWWGPSHLSQYWFSDYSSTFWSLAFFVRTFWYPCTSLRVSGWNGIHILLSISWSLLFQRLPKSFLNRAIFSKNWPYSDFQRHPCLRGIWKWKWFYQSCLKFQPRYCFWNLSWSFHQDTTPGIEQFFHSRWWSFQMSFWLWSLLTNHALRIYAKGLQFAV